MGSHMLFSFPVIKQSLKGASVYISLLSILVAFLLSHYCISLHFATWTTHLPWRWRQQVPSKRQHLSNKLHGITSQKTGSLVCCAVFFCIKCKNLWLASWYITSYTLTSCQPLQDVGVCEHHETDGCQTFHFLRVHSLCPFWQRKSTCCL